MSVARVKRARTKPERKPAPGLKAGPSPEALACRRKFLRYFPKGFTDPLYIDWERGYKLTAHEGWKEMLGRATFESLLEEEKFEEIAARAIRLESRTNLLFSFEKMALRDAVKSPHGARAFATGLYQYIHGRGSMESKFTQWCRVVESLPRRQTRVLTWPLVTVFGFIALPQTHIFLKPNVTRRAAAAYGYEEFTYRSRPDWDVYSSLLRFAETIAEDLADLTPRDMIDIQSFIWVQGSDEYP